MTEILLNIYNYLTRKRVMQAAFLAPITKNMTKDFDYNTWGFRNGGNSTVQFQNGAWTLAPGETLMLGSQTDVNDIRFQGLDIRFEPTPGEVAAQVDRLQILTINQINC